MYKKLQTVLLMIAKIAVLIISGCSVAPPPIEPLALSSRRISPTDSRFLYEGRFDFSDANRPVIIWQASRISIDFEGDLISLFFDDVKGQNYFNANLDDSTTIIEINQDLPCECVTLDDLGAGRHHLVLFKRSEAGAGTVRFRGIEIPPGCRAWSPDRSKYKLTMEFIGDSLTAGACNEDGETDQWENLRTHNSALSYAAMTAEAFSADHRNIAVSGMGATTGWTEVKAGQIWNRLYARASSPLADLGIWTPDVVFVFLGANDDSFTRAKGQPFPTDYSDKYVSLVQEIRIAYPGTQIVLLMSEKYSPSLRQAWETAVSQLETDDKAIRHYVFESWVENRHPRVADHRMMANELITWLKKQPFM